MKDLIDKQTKYELIFPNILFAETKKRLLLEIPICISNENTVERFLDKLQSFAYHNIIDIVVKWPTKKIRGLFCLKDKNLHPACKVYEDTCSCSFCFRWNKKKRRYTLE